MENKNILWYQPETLKDNDVIVFNGNKILQKSDYSRYFQELKRISDKRIGRKAPWCGRIEGFYFVKGYFDAKDEKGRMLNFLFISNEKDGFTALTREVQNLNYKLTEETARIAKSKNSVIYLVTVIAIVLIIMTIILLFSNYGN